MQMSESYLATGVHSCPNELRVRTSCLFLFPGQGLEHLPGPGVGPHREAHTEELLTETKVKENSPCAIPTLGRCINS